MQAYRLRWQGLTFMNRTGEVIVGACGWSGRAADDGGPVGVRSESGTVMPSDARSVSSTSGLAWQRPTRARTRVTAPAPSSYISASAFWIAFRSASVMPQIPAAISSISAFNRGKQFSSRVVTALWHCFDSAASCL